MLLMPVYTAYGNFDCDVSCDQKGINVEWVKGNFDIHYGKMVKCKIHENKKELLAKKCLSLDSDQIIVITKVGS